MGEGDVISKMECTGLRGGGACDYKSEMMLGDGEEAANSAEARESLRCLRTMRKGQLWPMRRGCSG